MGGIAAARRETLLQVIRLAATGVAQIASRFEQADAQTSEIMSALRNLENQRSSLRPHRDWLYCTLMEWEPVLQEWEASAGVPEDEKLWRMMERAYRFLAPRYMAVQEWHASAASRPMAERGKSVVW